MSRVSHRIHVEGEGEVVFFAYLIHDMYPSTSFEFSDENMRAVIKYEGNRAIEVLAMGGIDPKKLDRTFAELKYSTQEGVESLLVIDADSDDPSHSPPGGYENRREYIESKKKDHGLDELPFFIIPEPEKSGNLESLLEQVISDKGKSTYDCITMYLECLVNINDEQRPTFVKEKLCVKDGAGKFLIKQSSMRKIGLEYYVYLMLGDKKARRKTHSTGRDYSDPDIWDMRSDGIRQIRDFLFNHLPDLPKTS